MKSLGDHGSMRPSGQTQPSGGNGDDRSAVVGNERLTALAGAVLLVLIVVELVSSASLHAGIAIHIFVGVLLVGPLAVKLGSTRLRAQRPAPPAAAGAGAAARRHDPRGDRQRDRTRGDRPGAGWPTPPHA